MKRKAKNLKLLFVIEDDSYMSTTLLDCTVSVDSSDGYSTFHNSISKGMNGIKDMCEKIAMFPTGQIMTMFTEAAAAREARVEEAAKYKEGGDVWRVQNQNNELVSENACLKKQVQDLINQLDKNISKGE
jgi:hypothetical protein